MAYAYESVLKFRASNDFKCILSGFDIRLKIIVDYACLCLIE